MRQAEITGEGEDHYQCRKVKAERDGLRNGLEKLKTELERREVYWRDWNGRAANRNASLEAENKLLLARIEQLEMCCTQRGARMQMMRQFMESGYFEYRAINSFEQFTLDHPKAKDWFDENGVAR